MNSRIESEPIVETRVLDKENLSGAFYSRDNVLRNSSLGKRNQYAFRFSE